MKKALSTIAVVLILAVVASVSVFAQSYSTVLYMNQETPSYSGSTRKFDGPSIKMTMTLDVSKTMFSNSWDAQLRANLYRKSGLFNLGSTFISYEDYPVGTYSRTWKNVGAGSYYWNFEKKCADPLDSKYYSYFTGTDIVMSDCA